jgi:signal-transduction protein with cAMP-binding, CBS, and nucleotidyltransferase domain
MGTSVGQICNRNTVTCASDAEIRNVVALMSERHVGSVILVQEMADGPRPYGIVTDRDLVVRIIAAGVDMDSLTIRDVATMDITVVQENDGIGEAVHLMHEAGINRLPVVDRRGILIGVISGDDLLLHLAEQVQELASLFMRAAR